MPKPVPKAVPKEHLEAIILPKLSLKAAIQSSHKITDFSYEQTKDWWVVNSGIQTVDRGVLHRLRHGLECLGLILGRKAGGGVQTAHRWCRGCINVSST